MSIATLTSKGQITIPVDVRRDLGLDTGSRIDFVRRDGVYIMIPVSHSVARLAGFFGDYDGPPATIEQMNEVVAEAMGEM